MALMTGYRIEDAGSERISVKQALSILIDVKELHKYSLELKMAIGGEDVNSLHLRLVCRLFLGHTVTEHETGTS